MQVHHKLRVWKRERIGSRYAQRERSAGRLPAVLYGHGQAPLAISLDHKEALRCFETGEKVFEIELKEEGLSQTVLVKELQFGYLGDNVVHVDLARVDLDEEIESQVSIHLVGDAIGLKKAGTILTHPTMSITVRCKVRDLPDHINVDISQLDVGNVIHAGEVTLPPGIKLESDPDSVLAAVAEQRVEEVAAEATAVAGEAAQPEVIGEKEKKEKEKEAE